MTYQVPGCAICNTPRCSLCRLEKFRVGWKDQRQTLYTFCKDAALRGLTTRAPGSLQPPGLKNITTNITCTTLEPDPTYDQVGCQEGVHSVPTPKQFTPQSLTEKNIHRQRDTQVLPTAKPGEEVLLSSLSLNQEDGIDISPDPSSLASSIPEQVPDCPFSRRCQTDTIDIIIHAFKRWRAEGSNDFTGSSSPRNTVPLSSSQPRKSTAPERSRKRTSNQGSSPKQGGSKRAKVSSDEASQAKKEDKRLLACPFWKKDPIRHRNCFRGVKRIRDVKQHLRRSHTQPVFCRRCGTEFGDEEAALSEHLRAAELCEIRYFQDPDGVTALHQKALKRHSDRSADEAAQWYVIWDYLFSSRHDGDTAPTLRPNSPYVDHDLSEEMSSFREFSHREGWRSLADDPDLSDVAFHIDEQLLQRCLNRIYENWLARKSTNSQQSWEESSFTLSDSSSPDERAPTRDAANTDHQLREDNTMALSDFAADLEFGSHFFGTQIDSVFDDFILMPSLDNNTAETFPSVPLLTSEYRSEQATQVATLDPTLTSR